MQEKSTIKEVLQKVDSRNPDNFLTDIAKLPENLGIEKRAQLLYEPHCAEHSPNSAESFLTN